MHAVTSILLSRVKYVHATKLKIRILEVLYDMKSSCLLFSDLGLQPKTAVTMAALLSSLMPQSHSE